MGVIGFKFRHPPSPFQKLIDFSNQCYFIGICIVNCQQSIIDDEFIFTAINYRYIHRVYWVALMNFHTFHDMPAIADVNIRASDNFNVENFIHVALDLLTGKGYQHHYS